MLKTTFPGCLLLAIVFAAPTISLNPQVQAAQTFRGSYARAGARTLSTHASGEVAQAAAVTPFTYLAEGYGYPAAIAANRRGDVVLTETPPPLSPGPNQKIPSAAGHLVKVSAEGIVTVLLTGRFAPGVAALDEAENTYFVSADNHLIRLTRAGVMNDLRADGIDHAYGMAVDRHGNVFLADSNHNRVLKITPAGVQSNVGAGLRIPTGLAVDDADNLYIADTRNNRVVRIAANGNQSVVPTAPLKQPMGVAVDGAGDLFIDDSGNRRTLVVTHEGALASLPLLLGKPFNYTIAADDAGDVFVPASDVLPNYASNTDSAVRIPHDAVESSLSDDLSPPKGNGPTDRVPDAQLATVIATPPPPAFEYAGKRLYLLAGGCEFGGFGETTGGAHTGLYFAAQDGKLAGLREIADCGLYDVRDDEEGACS